MEFRGIKCISLCNHRYHPFPKRFHHPKQKTCPWETVPPQLPSYSVTMNVPFLDATRKWNYTISVFCDTYFTQHSIFQVLFSLWCSVPPQQVNLSVCPGFFQPFLMASVSSPAGTLFTSRRRAAVGVLGGPRLPTASLCHWLCAGPCHREPRLGFAVPNVYSSLKFNMSGASRNSVFRGLASFSLITHWYKWWNVHVNFI